MMQIFTFCSSSDVESRSYGPCAPGTNLVDSVHAVDYEGRETVKNEVP
jgi:hypothetical protein